MSRDNQKKDLMSLKVSELRGMLKSNGLTTKGRKQELIDRLMAIESCNTNGKANYVEFDSSYDKEENDHEMTALSSIDVTPFFARTTSRFSHINSSMDPEFYCNGSDDLNSTGETSSQIDETHFSNPKLSLDKRTVNDKQSLSEIVDNLRKMVPFLTDVCKEIEKFESVTAAYDQRIAQLELKNAQLEKMVSKLVIGSLDYEHERSNVVVYGVDKRDVNGKEAVDEYALNFVRKYLPNYEESDMKARSFQNGENNSVLISMACSADAFRLTKRCRLNGFTKVRQGLTKPERMISKGVTVKTSQLNSELNKTTDKIYIKRHVHSLIKVKKNAPRKPLATFSPQFDLSNLNGTVTFNVTNMTRKTNTRFKQAPGSEQRPHNSRNTFNPTIGKSLR